MYGHLGVVYGRQCVVYGHLCVVYGYLCVVYGHLGIVYSRLVQDDIMYVVMYALWRSALNTNQHNLMQ